VVDVQTFPASHQDKKENFRENMRGKFFVNPTILTQSKNFTASHFFYLDTLEMLD
jgi:hypothetical protein